MLHKIFRYFGLITIRRAREIHVELAALRERAIMEDAHKDFGVSARPNFETETRQWAAESFDKIVRDGQDKVLALTEEEARVAGYIVKDGFIYHIEA